MAETARPKLLVLEEWASTVYGNHPPSIMALRRWARESKIFLAPERQGKRYYVRTDARYLRGAPPMFDVGKRRAPGEQVAAGQRQQVEAVHHVVVGQRVDVAAGRLGVGVTVALVKFGDGGVGDALQRRAGEVRQHGGVQARLGCGVSRTHWTPNGDKRTKYGYDAIPTLDLRQPFSGDKITK